MSQSDTSWMDKGENNVDDDGVRIRGEHYMRQGGPPPEGDDPMPGLWIGHGDGIAKHFLEIQEFGSDSLYPNDVVIEREEIPKVVEALIERAYPRDAEYLRERVELALEEFEANAETELTYEE